MEKGLITVICPKCQEHPEITTTPRGERTMVTCKCGMNYLTDTGIVLHIQEKL